jgi:hypothetical protein
MMMTMMMTFGTTATCVSSLRVARRVGSRAHVNRARRLSLAYLSGYDHGLAIVVARASSSVVENSLSK